MRDVRNTSDEQFVAVSGDAEATLDVRVANLDCENDAAKIQRALGGAPGVSKITVYPKAARVSVRFAAGTTSADSLKNQLRDLGFPAQGPTTMVARPRPWRNPRVVTSALSGVLLLTGWLLSRGGAPEVAATAVFIASLIIGGYYFGREAIEELLLEREVGIELLMATAAVVATLMGEPFEGAMLAFLYSMSEAAEGYTGEKTRAAVKALMNLAPRTARVRRDGGEVDIPAEEVKAGDVFVVLPGQSMPTDGEVVIGQSSVDQAPVTGESVPVEKNVGDTVFAGTINGEGALEVRATKAFADNTIARIIHMVEEAQERKGNSERFIERFGKRYSPAVLAIGILIAILPPLLTDAAWREWIARATVFIVAAAPCALVISIPIALVATLGTAARRGVLIKGGVFVEDLAKVRVVALDKTGTITHGAPEVTDMILLAGSPLAAERVLAAAAGIESRSQHPLARAILRYAKSRGVTPASITDFRSLTGAGAAARLDSANGGQEVLVGSPALFERELRVSLGEVAADVSRFQMEGKTVIVVGDAGSAWSILAIRDNVRPNAASAIRALHASGVRTVAMLTGDNERTARAIAREVGIDEVYADLTPEDKAGIVRNLTARDGHVAMVGDGVNDAPALAEATVGVAMGAAGTDVALETADVALMADDLDKLVYALRLARRHERVVRQNLALSVIVITVLVVGAVLGQLTLPLAVIGHEMSEFVVIASGLRMLRG
ncbi:heavy metal translocating P-type ATPase [Pseudogemmatithrix spongiicola]|uniref:Heavy metal translocating P-type ATPase n=1 Tax=Pseudogemmatithrix spongiicola TaxID=3062599 RepID=A0AA49K2Z4_9BACT|nr:heavy metal translocating P-type ATPase [Gemmatimonadaceae bacterium 'strain 138']WKW16579.1 heavy metal translocating P-type ATPase [Gemmatimonadaceae bacterium 'strain 318']